MVALVCALSLPSARDLTMQTVLLVVHMMIAAALVVVVLVQRSEGGALGIGGGGGFMSGRGAANALTRLTTYLAAAFFSTSIALALLSNHNNQARSVFDTPAAATAPAVPGTAPATTDAPSTTGRGGVLDKLQTPGGGQAPAPRAPQGQ
jgi:preprotein translocase subunit SecG